MSGSDATFCNNKRGDNVTTDEKIKFLAEFFAMTGIVPKEKKDEIAGMVIGYGLAHQFKETKGA